MGLSCLGLSCLGLGCLGLGGLGLSCLGLSCLGLGSLGLVGIGPVPRVRERGLGLGCLGLGCLGLDYGRHDRGKAVSAAVHPEPVRRLPAAGLPEAARGFLGLAIVAAVAAAAATTIASPSHVRWTVFTVLVVGGALAQVFATHTTGNQVFHTGLAFTIAAALLLPPELVVVVAVAQHLPEWLRQRYPWFIQSFNIANVALSGLAAWSVRAVFVRDGVHVTAAAGTAGVLVTAAAAGTFVLMNHALLARMLRLARGHDLSASGLFTLDGLIVDGVVAAVGVGIAFTFMHSSALALVVALPLVLIQRLVAADAARAGVHSPQDGAAQLARHRSARPGPGRDTGTPTTAPPAPSAPSA
jgi:hypothetical protein